MRVNCPAQLEMREARKVRRLPPLTEAYIGAIVERLDLPKAEAPRKDLPATGTTGPRILAVSLSFGAFALLAACRAIVLVA